MESALAGFGMTCVLNMDQYLITFVAPKHLNRDVSRNSKILLRLLSVRVPALQALRVLDEAQGDIIYTGFHEWGLCNYYEINMDKYLKRKKFLTAIPEKELGQLTGCEVYVRPMNDVVAAIGPLGGLKIVRKLVTDSIVYKVDPLSFMSKYKLQLQKLNSNVNCEAEQQDPIPNDVHHYMPMEIENSGSSSDEDYEQVTIIVQEDIITFRSPFPRSQATDVQEAWPAVESALGRFCMMCVLDMDQYFIKFFAPKHLSRDASQNSKMLLRLLSARVPARQALRVLDEVPCDIIYTGLGKSGVCTNYGIKMDKYLKRKEFLMAIPEKELEQFTGCEVYVRPMNDVVAAIGPVRGLKIVRKLVTDSIVHKVDPLSLMKRYKHQRQICMCLVWLNRNVNGKAKQQDKLKKPVHDPIPNDTDHHISMEIKNSGLSLHENIVEVTVFATEDIVSFRYPFLKFQATDVQEAWPAVNSVLRGFGMACALDMNRACITFFAPKPMKLNACRNVKVFLLLLSVGVPARQAIRIFNEVAWDTIYTGFGKEGICSNYGIKNLDDYLERKKRLKSIPEKELGQFTGCEVYVRPRNGLVAAIGPVEGLKVVRKFVTDCIVDNADPLSLMSQYKFVLEVSECFFRLNIC
ncbi:hypothetical protein ACE6H2_022038 [Prunus campanulata]